jgi:pimeloyl-ACP methyl ester carboxylesterase
MARCILALYRSAVTVGAEWQPAVDAMPHRPAVVFHGGDDPYVDVAVMARLGARLDAPVIVYEGCSHWWAWERAADVAATLTDLWS